VQDRYQDGQRTIRSLQIKLGSVKALHVPMIGAHFVQLADQAIKEQRGQVFVTTCSFSV
jgi:hypothetical protein